MTARTLGSVALVTALLWSGDAPAYCRTTPCGLECNPLRPSDSDGCKVIPECGTPVDWGRDCVGYALQRDGYSKLPLRDVRAIVKSAFSAWTAADCGGGETPSIRLEDLGSVDCGTVEYNCPDPDTCEEDGGNVNIVVFREDSWPVEKDPNALALTTVTFDIDDNLIIDADLEVNTLQPQFELYDLASIITHEVGHFLGLGHSLVPTATMKCDVGTNSTEARTLDPDDIAGVCAAYPPNGAPPSADDCNPIPKHGFADACGEAQVHGDCSAAATRRGDSHAMLWMLLVLGGAARRRKRVR